jgi:hypothetical protein
MIEFTILDNQNPGVVTPLPVNVPVSTPQPDKLAHAFDATLLMRQLSIDDDHERLGML